MCIHNLTLRKSHKKFQHRTFLLDNSHERIWKKKYFAKFVKQQIQIIQPLIETIGKVIE